ncbi:hypothetical protein [Micromonospora sp. NBC_01813]|uniref:hypothetical protein n=1 Tax=Micromonospora sp. NBC_01813 TaxID=2975988 RepID=UPI002DDA23FA|nr:hypothetical protein [Micromonospora sp. NBC_01813]WSA07513.1 hypothetical protein OG958_25175 [Micromonospora sp. NBC_01813]
MRFGSDAAANYDTTPDGEPVRDRYLLQFWPGPAEPDRIVRQTTRFGADFHCAFGTPR